MRFKWLGRRMLFVIGAGIVATVAVAGIAYATVPDSSGVIHGCYNNNGNLRVIDSSSDACKSSETALNWSQSGVPGPAGAKGATGARGPTGSAGAAGAKGATGARGPTGAAGAAGPTGAKGATGARGPTGSAGAAGAKGATGAQGPPGSNGTSGFQAVSVTSGAIAPGSDVAGSFGCPAGKTVVGGGFSDDASPPFGSNVTLLQSNLSADGTAWTGSMHNGSSSAIHVTLTVLCMVTSSSSSSLSRDAMARERTFVITKAH